MILKLLQDFNPEYIAAVFDSKGKTIRHQEFKEYKATRRETPDDLSVQIPYIKQIVQLLGIKILQLEGFEADDIIGTVAKKAAKEGYEVIVVSPDKDMLQLVSQNIKVFNPVSEILYDEEKVIEKYGIKPSQFVDYLTMIGDSIDNVPGIKGIGPKTAQKLLSEFGSLENILQNKDELSKKYKGLADADINQIETSKKLVTLCDVPVNIGIEELKRGNPDLIRLKELFKELGFKSLISESQKQKQEKKTPAQKSLF